VSDGRDVRLSLFCRNFAGGLGSMFGYGTGIALTLMAYKWLGIIPFDWLRTP
jgi:hypothetical protein